MAAAARRVKCGVCLQEHETHAGLFKTDARKRFYYKLMESAINHIIYSLEGQLWEEICAGVIELNDFLALLVPYVATARNSLTKHPSLARFLALQDGFQHNLASRLLCVYRYTKVDNIQGEKSSQEFQEYAPVRAIERLYCRHSAPSTPVAHRGTPRTPAAAGTQLQNHRISFVLFHRRVSSPATPPIHRAKN